MNACSPEERFLDKDACHGRGYRPFRSPMINEPLIQKRYLNIPPTELKSRQTQLEAERLTTGRLSKGKRTYRRRLQKALSMREAEQRAQQTRYMYSQDRPIYPRLTAQQRYDKGSRQGRSDALCDVSSRERSIEDPEEQRGYRDAFRSTQRPPRISSCSSWD